MRLGKTQRKLLSQAVRHNGTMVTCTHWGASCGRRTLGRRDRNAMLGLVNAGLATITHRYTSAETRRGQSMHTSEWVAVLTQKGRDVATLVKE
jgi:hypothetical protein